MSDGLRICSNQEMREIDRLAETEYGISPTALMENAGRAATEILLRRYPQSGRDKEILVFAGKGNNAGDAFVVARQLLCLGRKVRVFHLVKGSDYKGSTLENFKILQKMKAKLVSVEQALDLESYFEQARGPHIAVDGIIGTGLKGNLEGHFYEVVELLNRHCEVIMSLDIPTGVSGDSGQVQGIAVQATLTISFGFPRLGHFLPPGATYRGKLLNVDISLPYRFSQEGEKFLLRSKSIKNKISGRDRYAHKNTFGHVFLVGGSPGRTGAIAMATKAAMRTGVGLATAATWSDSISYLISQIPAEAMTAVLPENEKNDEGYHQQIRSFNSVVIGPGMGTRAGSKRVIEVLLQNYQGPVVIDADALNVIGESKLHHLLQYRKAPTVLTPHPGEMARLIGWQKEMVLQNPVGAIQKAVELTHSVVLLKGAATLISSPEGVLYLNHFPNSGMAKAGSGDVLAGMIGAWLAQGMSALDASQTAVYLHSLAGARAAMEVNSQGMVAGDIISCIPYALEDLKKKYHEEEEPRLSRLL